MYNKIYCKDIVPISSSLNQAPDITKGFRTCQAGQCHFLVQAQGFERDIS